MVNEMTRLVAESLSKQALTRRRIAAGRSKTLMQYRAPFRPYIAELVCCSDEALDVASSFPALLFALVTDYGTVTGRREAFQAILEGRSLAAAADAIGLPMWLRRLPAGAFRTPFGDLSVGPRLSADVCNFIPQNRRDIANWLDWVIHANLTSGPAFALWTARHHAALRARCSLDVFDYMAAWAWYSNRFATVGHAIIPQPWHPRMGVVKALDSVRIWRRRIALAYVLGEDIECAWLRSDKCYGYDFVPLMSLEDFISESDEMRNCLDQYAQRLSTGLIRVFSIRKGAQRIADIEVGPKSKTGKSPQIIQLKRARNLPPTPRIWQAAQLWISRQPQELRAHPGRVNALPLDQARTNFWQPYFDWLPPEKAQAFAARVYKTQKRRAPVSR